MADINGAGGAVLGGLTGTGVGHVEWWTVEVIEPLDGSSTPTTAPDVKVQAETWNGSAVNVQVQVSTSVGFGSTVYDSTASEPGDGVTPGVISLSGLVNLTTYYVRARIRVTGYDGPWSPVVSFTVDERIGEVVEYIYSNVGIENVLVSDAPEYVYENVGILQDMSPDVLEYIYSNIGVLLNLMSSHIVEYAYEGDVNTLTPNPVIWFLAPSFGREGDGIAIYGFGFGDLQTTYSGTVQVDYGGVVVGENLALNPSGAVNTDHWSFGTQRTTTPPGVDPPEETALYAQIDLVGLGNSINHDVIDLPEAPPQTVRVTVWAYAQGLGYGEVVFFTSTPDDSSASSQYATEVRPADGWVQIVSEFQTSVEYPSVKVQGVAWSETGSAKLYLTGLMVQVLSTDPNGGWQTVPVVSWQTFPPDANAYTEDRLLDETTQHIDMQHQVVEIVVPPGAIPPGYPVRICTDGP